MISADAIFCPKNYSCIVSRDYEMINEFCCFATIDTVATKDAYSVSRQISNDAICGANWQFSGFECSNVVQ